MFSNVPVIKLYIFYISQNRLTCMRYSYSSSVKVVRNDGMDKRQILNSSQD